MEIRTLKIEKLAHFALPKEEHLLVCLMFSKGMKLYSECIYVKIDSLCVCLCAFQKDENEISFYF